MVQDRKETVGDMVAFSSAFAYLATCASGKEGIGDGVAQALQVMRRDQSNADFLPQVGATAPYPMITVAHTWQS